MYFSTFSFNELGERPPLATLSIEPAISSAIAGDFILVCKNPWVRLSKISSCDPESGHDVDFSATSVLIYACR